jgi:PAS domain S-box-containing protein
MKSLRNKLLIGFMAFSIISLLILIPSSNYYFERRESISKIIHQTEVMNKHMLQDFRVITSFFRHEPSNPNFFITGNSSYLLNHRHHSRKIHNELDNLLNNPDLSRLNIKKDLTYLREDYNQYQQILNRVAGLLLERGFKDYGTVGEMRHYIHQLEDFSHVDQTQVLSLRRHEKDYIIRHQEQYIEKLNRRSKNFREQIRQNNSLPESRKDSALILLKKYTRQFNQMVTYDQKIGLHNNSGLKHRLDEMEKKMEKRFETLTDTALKKKTTVYARLKYYYIAFFFILVGLIIVASSYTSRWITRPLTHLANYISEFVKNGFYHPKKLKIPDQKDEIAILYKEFVNLIQQLDQREKEKQTARFHLKENEIHFKELANMLPQCVFETDSLGNFTYVNKTWVDTFGYSKKDIKGRLNFTDILTQYRPNNHNGRHITNNEYIARRKDGSTFHALVYTNKILRDNSITGIRGIIIDNTQSKKYQQELEKARKKAETSDKLKSSFLANMSHEIRTPVHAIMGFSDFLLKETEDRKQQEEFVQIIHKSSQDLLNLINDIIDLAKIEAGEIKISRSSCHLNTWMDELYLTFNTLLDQRNKTHLNLSIHKALWDDNFVLYTDPGRLKQIFSNLLNNATKYTSEGYIEFGYVLQNASTIKFYVEDSGQGLSSSQQEVIFERFRQANHENPDEIGGAGLGLTIAKSLVELLGGKIWLESKPGIGTTFYFTHPITLKNKENTGKKEKASQ